MAHPPTPSKESAKPAPARNREQPEVRKRLLVEATTRSIAKYGYSGITIERICAEGGVSRGLINHHFGSKDELLLQSYKTLCDQWKAYALDGMKDMADPADALRSCINRNFDEAMFNPQQLRIWLGFWSVIPKSPKLQKLDRALYHLDLKIYQDVLERLAHKNGLDIDTRAQSVALMALIAGLWLQAALDPQSLSATQARSMCLNAVAHLF
jgi:AcrR family transcriptional regulator